MHKPRLPGKDKGPRSVLCIAKGDGHRGARRRSCRDARVERKGIRDVADLYNLSRRRHRESRAKGREIGNEADRSDRGEQGHAAFSVCFTASTFVTSANGTPRYSQIISASIDKLAAATVEELDDIHEIGLAVAESVYEWFRNPLHIDLINRLKAAGVKMEADGELEPRISMNDSSARLLFSPASSKITPATRPPK